MLPATDLSMSQCPIGDVRIDTGGGGLEVGVPNHNRDTGSEPSLCSLGMDLQTITVSIVHRAKRPMKKAYHDIHAGQPDPSAEPFLLGVSTSSAAEKLNHHLGVCP